jgi:acrylyl-CoA reductase (NADPH)
MSDFKAIVITKGETGTSATLTRFPDADLMEGEVTIAISHSTMNYKDGLAITGRAPVVRRFPMIPGIDFAGTVLTSADARYKPGDAVILNGWGVGETHLGGYAERARVKADWLLPQPEGLTAQDAMAIGTAGYTAMLALQALERYGLTPAQGPVLVTGASGGVGSIAISLLSSAGYTVIASTGRMAEADYLISLGADEVIERASLSAPAKPLAKERWAGAIDSVGSHTLANALSMTRYGGAVAACGLAQGMDLPTSVAPFILRGVALLGIDSVMASYEKRQSAWSRLSEMLDRAKLTTITRTIALEDVIATAPDLLDGKVRGRLVVTI